MAFLVCPTCLLKCIDTTTLYNRVCLSVCLFVGNTEKADQQIKQVKESCASYLKGKDFTLLVGPSAFVHEFAHLTPPQAANQSIKGSNQPS